MPAAHEVPVQVTVNGAPRTATVPVVGSAQGALDNYVTSQKDRVTIFGGVTLLDARLEHTPLPAFADMDGEIEAYHGAMPVNYSPEDLPDLLQFMQRRRSNPDGLVDRWAGRFVRPRGRSCV